MIQSSYNKPIEMKAPKADLPKPSSVSSASKNEYSKKPSVAEKKREASEFEDELKAAGAEKHSEPKVKEVAVSEEQQLEKPSSLVSPQAQEAKPAVFDPEMTLDVEQAIHPKNAQAPQLTDEQVMQLANAEVDTAAVAVPVDAELAQAMMKTPQVKAAQGEANTELDSKLMSMEDFVAQKNMTAKKPMNVNAYGAQKPNMQKIAMENDLKQSQVVNDITLVKDGQSQPMNAQQFILNMKSENGNAKGNEVAGAQKVFDMSHVKSSNADQIMNQISDYIVQAKAAKEPTVTMRVNHDELGMIDITVQKASQMNADSVAINIGAHSAEGKNFFQQNSKELFSHLASSGINVSDMKLETPSQSSKSDFDMNGRSQQGNQGSEKQFASEQNQRRQDSDRRQDLWKLLNKEAA